MTKFYLIRHGRAAAYHPVLGIKLRQGPGAHLNATGQSQSRILGQDLSKHNIDVMWSSPLTRAIETANILSESQNVPFRSKDHDLKDIFENGLTELIRPQIVYDAPLALDSGLNDDEILQYFANLEYKEGIKRAVASGDWDWKYRDEESYHELFYRETILKHQAINLYPGANLAFVGHSNAQAFLLGSMLLGDNPTPRALFDFSHTHFLRHGGLAIVEYHKGKFCLTYFDSRRT